MKHFERLFKALANKRRIDIIKLLTKNEQMSVSEIAENINISLKSTSKHLQKLENANLISRKQKSKWGYYSLNNFAPESLERLIIIFIKTT